MVELLRLGPPTCADPVRAAAVVRTTGGWSSWPHLWGTKSLVGHGQNALWVLLRLVWCYFGVTLVTGHDYEATWQRRT